MTLAYPPLPPPPRGVDDILELLCTAHSYAAAWPGRDQDPIAQTILQLIALGDADPHAVAVAHQVHREALAASGEKLAPTPPPPRSIPLPQNAGEIEQLLVYGRRIADSQLALGNTGTCRVIRQLIGLVEAEETLRAYTHRAYRAFVSRLENPRAD